ncbi:YsnF/AvaK domain-containing protein [Arthrobacter sp. NPDC093139]|uniref:YsnF/AvaK domain-containing protein n=1 Tax=Arthrobacter sp. NPDC093139 TaxID=3363945 RepID=UPI0038177513
MSGPDLKEDEHEVTVHEERPVVDKETVPVGRARLDKDTVTDDVSVQEEVRKENFDTDITRLLVEKTSAVPWTSAPGGTRAYVTKNRPHPSLPPSPRKPPHPSGQGQGVGNPRNGSRLTPGADQDRQRPRGCVSADSRTPAHDCRRTNRRSGDRDSPTS